MIKPTISIKGKITTPIKIQGKTNASIIREYPELENLEVTPSGEEQTFKSKMYGYDEVKVKGVTAEVDEDIKPENIIEGVDILGVKGNFKGVDSSNATAVASDILQNKTAYINNQEVAGTIEKYDGSYSGNISEGDEWEAIFKSSIDNTLGANVTKLPSGITTIRAYAFRENSKLPLTELPETITSIGAYAFHNCTNLALKKLPSDLVSLGNYSFCNCIKSSFSEIPDKITKLPTFCFNKCTGLTSIKILGDITEFEGQVFYQASNLEKVILPNITSVPVLGSNVFTSTEIAKKRGYIYVPDSLVEEIKIASNWSTFADQIKPISELEV